MNLRRRAAGIITAAVIGVGMLGAGVASAGFTDAGVPFGVANCSEQLGWDHPPAIPNGSGYAYAYRSSGICQIGLKLYCGTYPSGSWTSYASAQSGTVDPSVWKSCPAGQSILGLCMRISNHADVGPYAYWNENAHAWQYTDC